MPHSPVTRFLAALLVVVAAILLFWPEEVELSFGLLLSGAAPLLAAVFTWSAVRDAPPFDTNAFHRTLPGGNREGFRHVLRIHAWVFAGIALLLLAYAVIYNVRWPDFVYSLAIVLLPLMAICGLTGALESLGAAGRRWRIPAWLGMLGLYVGSLAAALILWDKSGGLRGQNGDPVLFYLSGVRCALLAAAFGFPLCWWLVAVRRRKFSGFLGIAISGALLPWFAVHANFFRAPRSHPLPPPPSSLVVARKPLPADFGKWLAADEMLNPAGLQEGEFVRGWIKSMTLSGRTPFESVHGEFQELPGEIWSQGPRVAMQWKKAEPTEAPVWFGKSGGRVVWGEAGMWEHLASQLPAHRSFERFDPKAPGIRAQWPGTILGCFVPNEFRDIFTRGTWSLEMAGTLHWEAIGSCKAASGGRFRLSRGGVLEVEPLAKYEGKETLTLSYRGPRFEAGPAWIGGSGESAAPRELMLLLMDESGTRAFALGSTRWDGSLYYMTDPGKRQSWSLGSEDPERVTLLRGGTLYLFQPVSTGTTDPEVVLPPP